MRNLIPMALLVISTAIPAYAANTSQPTKDFIKKAAIGSRFEIESSQLAVEKSGNNDIKTFAQKMIDDHTKAANQMKDAMNSANLDSTLLPQDMDSKHSGMMDKLKAATGKAFDQMYVADQNDAHNEAVQLFTQYSKNGDNPTMKDYAAKTLPTLEQHKKHVEELKP